jgi:hypothetical protein
MRVLPHAPTTSHLSVLALLYTGSSSLHRPRDSPLIYGRQGSLLLHKQLKPWVPPCVLFVWWFSPWDIWGFWLVDIVVLPMKLQTFSAPSVLTPPLWTTCLVQWLAAGCEELLLYLARLCQLYQAPVSKHFFPSSIVSGFGDCIWDGCPGMIVSGWPLLQSLPLTLSPCLFL